MTVRDLPRAIPSRAFLRNLLVDALGVLSYPHHPDRYLELADPLMATADNRGRITHVDRTAEGLLTLTVRPARALRFVPGQHVDLSLHIDGVRRTRCYSPASVPSGSATRHDNLVFTIGRRPGGLVSRHLHEHANVGDIVELGTPGGEFVLPAPRPPRLLFVGAGSGITPVLSMLEGLVAEGYDGAATFLYYARTPAHVPRRAELDALADLPNVEMVYAYTRSDAGMVHGRFDRAHLAAVAPWYAHTPTYACGPRGMLDSLREVYDGHGTSELLHVEQFTPPTPVPVPGDATGEVSFTASRIVAPNSGTTLLELAESAGLTPEHGCRMGICRSCTAIRASGSTRDVRTGEVDSEPGARIRICINAPVGDVSVEL